MPDHENNRTEWHLDKKVPATILILVLLNIAAGIWKASAIEHKVNELDRRTANNQLIIERLVKVETQVAAVKDSLLRIENALTRNFSR